MTLIHSPSLKNRPFESRILFSPDSRQMAVWTFSAQPQESAAELITLADGLNHVSLYPPSGEAWGLHSMAWDVTGQPRVILWWKPTDTDADLKDVIEVRSSLDGEVLWQVQNHALEGELCRAGRGLAHLQLHLYADTVRLLDRAGLHQVHHSGHRTFQPHDDTANLCLKALSGEVYSLQDAEQHALHSPNGRFDIEYGIIQDLGSGSVREVRVTLPAVCVPASRRQGSQQLYGLWLPWRQRYFQNQERQPYVYETQQQAVNALMAERFLSEPVEVSPLPERLLHQPGVHVVPRWMLGEQMLAPPRVPEATKVTFDLTSLETALQQNGWPVTAGVSLCTAVDLLGVTVVAEVLQRPGGTCALMTAWRGPWPARWEVWLSGTLEDAVEQLEEALGQGQHYLLQIPPERRSPAPQTSAILAPERTNAELTALLNSENQDEAMLAAAALWIRFQHLSAVLPGLKHPPEPDWNVLRLLWAEQLLPPWVLRPVWRALPAWVQQELAGDLQEEFKRDQEWEAWRGEA